MISNNSNNHQINQDRNIDSPLTEISQITNRSNESDRTLLKQRPQNIVAQDQDIHQDIYNEIHQCKQLLHEHEEWLHGLVEHKAIPAENNLFLNKIKYNQMLRKEPIDIINFTINKIKLNLTINQNNSFNNNSRESFPYNDSKIFLINNKECGVTTPNEGNFIEINKKFYTLEDISIKLPLQYLDGKWTYVWHDSYLNNNKFIIANENYEAIIIEFDKDKKKLQQFQEPWQIHDYTSMFMAQSMPLSQQVDNNTLQKQKKTYQILFIISILIISLLLILLIHNNKYKTQNYNRR